MLCFAILFHVNSEADGQYRRNKKFHKVGHDIRHHAKHKRAFHTDTADVFPVNRDKPCRTENVTYRKPQNICGEKAAEIRRLMFRVTVLSVPDYVGWCASVCILPGIFPTRRSTCISALNRQRFFLGSAIHKGCAFYGL